jgi:hypothetical protein
LVGCLLDQGRYALKPGHLCRAQASLAGHQLETIRTPPHHNRLDDTLLPYGMRQLLQTLGIEVLPGLLWIGPNLRHGKIDQLRIAGNVDPLKERSQPPA